MIPENIRFKNAYLNEYCKKQKQRQWYVANVVILCDICVFERFIYSSFQIHEIFLLFMRKYLSLH